MIFFDMLNFEEERERERRYVLLHPGNAICSSRSVLDIFPIILRLSELKV